MKCIVPVLRDSTGLRATQTPPSTHVHQSETCALEYRSLVNLAVSHLPGLFSALSCRLTVYLWVKPRLLLCLTCRPLVVYLWTDTLVFRNHMGSPSWRPQETPVACLPAPSSLIGALGHVPIVLEGALGRAVVPSPIHCECQVSVYTQASFVRGRQN